MLFSVAAVAVAVAEGHGELFALVVDVYLGRAVSFDHGFLGPVIGPEIGVHLLVPVGITGGGMAMLAHSAGVAAIVMGMVGDLAAQDVAAALDGVDMGDFLKAAVVAFIAMDMGADGGDRIFRTAS